MPKTTAIPTFDPTAMFAEFKLPTVDAVITAQRRNLEAVSAANKAAADGFKAVAARQAEIARGAVDEYVAAVRELMAAQDAPAGVAKQVEFAKTAFEKTVASTRELAEIAVKANAEAFDVFSKRVAEGLDEVWDLTNPQSTKPDAATKDSTKKD